MKPKEILLDTLKVFIFIFLLVFFVIIHEVGHCLSITLTGGECIGYGFDGAKAWTTIRWYTKGQFLIAVVAGSALSLSIAIILGTIFKRLDFKTGVHACCLSMISEIMYWLVSPIIQFGDAYMFFTAIGYTGWIAYYIFMLIIFIFGLIKYCIYLNNCIEEKYNV